MRGEIVSIEGTDFSGKKTQTRILVNRLRKEGIPCESISFPRYDKPSGKIVGGPFLGKLEICPSFWEDPMSFNPMSASMYYAADRNDAREEIIEILTRAHLISDIYVESNMAHQGAKAKTEKEAIEIIQFISKLEYELVKLPKPSGKIFLNVPPEVIRQLRERCTENKRYSDKAESSDEHLRKSIETYEIIIKLFGGWTRINCAPDGTINSLRAPEDIHEEVYAVARKIIG